MFAKIIYFFLRKTKVINSNFGDLHFIEQLSLLQFTLFFLLQLVGVALLYEEQLLSHLVVYVVHLHTSHTHGDAQARTH